MKKTKKTSPPQPRGEVIERGDPRVEPDWESTCTVCRMPPVLPLTGMCGPCTFGEASTAGGNWFS